MSKIATSPEVFDRFIDRKQFTTAAGLRSNQKYELSWLSRIDPLFSQIVEELGEWAISQNVEVLTAMPNGANRYARGVASNKGLPLALFIKQDNVLRRQLEVQNGYQALASGAKVGIVEDVSSTRLSVIEFTSKLRRTGRLIGPVAACSIVDRGQDVEGVETIDDIVRYAQQHPTEPPVRIPTKFSYDSLIQIPLGLVSEES